MIDSVQFHPEMTHFDESTASDGGFGATVITSFLALARAYWLERPEPQALDP
ncbi:MAG: hypothetical protein HYV09_05435 [Deltaproteobacteria bacterium]|nr:hypothetical protein [Deltaproteobacteria bacterium]